MNTQKISLDYQYNTLENIFQKVNIINNFDIIDYIILFIVILLSIIYILYIGPIIRFIFDSYLKEKEKEKKKLNLKKILIQKEIEEQIEKELYI